jgi:hypothetical protein
MTRQQVPKRTRPGSESSRKALAPRPAPVRVNNDRSPILAWSVMAPYRPQRLSPPQKFLVRQSLPLPALHCLIDMIQERPR